MTNPCEFAELVKQAFIEPIRSVLIVDDQYPTWEETLNDRRPEAAQDVELQKLSLAKKWRTDPESPASIIAQFRKQKPALVIDIHDATAPQPDMGGDPARALAPDHLHQSDLLILDYNLEGSSTGVSGILARSYLGSILRNQHFNLVVVHTEEPDLQAVFFDCILSLHKPCSAEFDNKQQDLISALEEKMDDWADDEKFNPKDLESYLDVGSYLNLRHPRNSQSNTFGQYMRPSGKAAGPLSTLAKWADELDLKGAERKAFALWAIKEFEKNKRELLSDTPFDGLSWSSEEGRLWLRTGRGFVTFVKKEEVDLLAELQESLIAWQPTPSRLLSSKLRHEITCNGVEAEDRSLSKKHVFAHFYDQVQNANSEQERAILQRDQLRRQVEALAFQIEDSIADFGEKIHNSDEASGRTYHSHYGVDLEKDGEANKALHHFNSYVSTLPIKPGADQLDCGHIFKIDNEWWVCATPACDLQPGQNSIAFVGHSQNLRPFTALKLQQIAENHSPDINSGEYCFVETSLGTIQCLSLRSPNGDAEGNADKATWRTFIAKGGGRFTDRRLELLVPKLTNDGIEPNEKTATVLGKLRYEYALNYVQKVGASVTRIGLGYAS